MDEATNDEKADVASTLFRVIHDSSAEDGDLPRNGCLRALTLSYKETEENWGSLPRNERRVLAYSKLNIHVSRAAGKWAQGPASLLPFESGPPTTDLFSRWDVWVRERATGPLARPILPSCIAIDWSRLPGLPHYFCSPADICHPIQRWFYRPWKQGTIR